ncbi:hypothetical protein PMIN06_010986 [Paraphaeosphaeria minitans]
MHTRVGRWHPGAIMVVYPTSHNNRPQQIARPWSRCRVASSAAAGCVGGVAQTRHGHGTLGRSAPALAILVLVSQGWEDAVGDFGIVFDFSTFNSFESSTSNMFESSTFNMFESSTSNMFESSTFNMFDSSTFNSCSTLSTGCLRAYACQEGPLEQVLPRRVCSPPFPRPRLEQIVLDALQQ